MITILSQIPILNSNYTLESIKKNNISLDIEPKIYLNIF